MPLSMLPAEPFIHTPLRAGTVACWLLVQLSALALSAGEVALWKDAPEPVDRLAMHQMLVVQILASSLLFPWMMPTLLSGLCMILISAPFVLLAGLLAEIPLGRAVAGGSYVAAWLIGLSCWATCLRSLRSQALGVLIAGGVVLGVPVLSYLRLEFHHFPPPDKAAMSLVNPLLGGLAQLRPENRVALQWFPAAFALVTGIVAGGWCRRTIKRQVIHTPS
jgi:hypothetical protein